MQVGEMSNVSDLLALIEQHREFLLSSSELPLLSYRHCVSEENFASAMLKTDVTIDNESPLAEYSGFRNTAFSDVVRLRLEVARGAPSESVNLWCEKLLRYVEVRYASLAVREKDANRPLSDSKVLFVQVLALFIELYRAQHDLRFLNAALKLLDLPWVKPNGSQENLASHVLYELSQVASDSMLEQIGNE